EGAPRYAREADDLLDTSALVCVLCDGLDDRAVDPCPLMQDDLAALHPMGAGFRAGPFVLSLVLRLPRPRAVSDLPLDAMFISPKRSFEPADLCHRSWRQGSFHACELLSSPTLISPRAAI